MEDSIQRNHVLVRGAITGPFEERRHLRLPSRIYGVLLHIFEAAMKIVGFKIADQQTIVSQKERVITPAGLTKRIQHLWPDRSMMRFIFVELFGLYL